MTKKLIIIAILFTILTSGTLYSCSINNTKKAVVNNVKSVLQTKNDLQLAVIPSGDQEITISVNYNSNYGFDSRPTCYKKK